MVNSAAETLRVISDEDVRRVISLDEVIELVEQAFVADADQKYFAFPVVRERLPEPQSGIFGVKAGLAGEALGLKAGGFWSNNRARGLPPHQSTMLLFDPGTGVPLAVVRANAITGLRTGAAGAVAARHLARSNSRTAALIGCGAQGAMQARALLRVLPLERLLLWDQNPEAVQSLVAAIAPETEATLEATENAEAAVRQADIVVTATPGTHPVVEYDWIRAGQHYTAIGADTAGKQELEPKILARAVLVVDNRQQAMTLGETQHLTTLGIAPERQIHGLLGEVIAGTRPGRTAAGEITVFDATGVTFQDLVVAWEVYRRCEAENLGVVAPL